MIDGYDNIRDFGLAFARMIANLAVDPHGYFEKKYTARIESAQTEHEIQSVVAQLVQWATSSAISDDERARLDRELGEMGLPSVNDLRLQFLP
jgi:hypothetical protein